MFSKIVALLLLSILAFGCRHQRSKTDCHQLFIQAEVAKIGVEDLYKEAIWQVYKFNLINTDSFMVENPFYVDSLFVETSLSEFNIKLGVLEKRGDTISFSLNFERGVYPVGFPYYGTVSFWGDEEKIEIGDRFIFTMDRSMFEPEFKDYLLKNKEKLSPMLKCLSVERGVWRDIK